MGVAYRAADARLGRSVALKTLHRSDAEHVYELKREFRRLAGLSHPNLVQLYELFALDDGCFFTMELLDGRDLVSALRDGRAPGDAIGGDVLARLATAFGQLAHGLKALHDSGQAHRDLKPSNVTLTSDGRVVLLDFGLASPLNESRLRDSSRGEAFYGSLSYAAPEQFWTTSAGAPADWYAVGAMLFEALTGQLPFRGTLEELVFVKQSRKPPRPSQIDPELPSALDDLVVRLLDPDPERRPGAGELLALFARSAAPASLPAPLPIPKVSGPFVGRDDELALLAGWLEDVRAGRAAVAHVRGVSGVGKTDLVQRFLARIPEGGGVVIAGCCHAQESVPYKAMDPLVDELSHVLLARLGRVVPALHPEQRDALRRLFPVLERVPAMRTGAPVDAPREPHEIRRQGFQALRSLLGQIASRSPVVLWIDDAQWGDLDSAALLRALLRGPGAPRILLLLTYRKEAAYRGALLDALDVVDETEARQGIRRHALDLEPLALSQTEALAEQMLGALPDADRSAVKTRIAEQAAGSPFYVGELVRYLASQHGESGSAAAVLGIARVTEARVERLSPDARTLLELVAVAAGPVATDVLLEAGGVGAAGWPLVIDLCGQCLLREGSPRGDRSNSLETYHDRVRETLLATLTQSPERLRLRHLQLAETLLARADADPQTLLQHFLGAGERGRAAEFALHAAVQASSALAFERAAELYATALVLRGERDEDWPLRVERAQALSAAGRSAAAAQLYERAGRQAARVSDDPEAVVSLHSRAAEQYLYGGMLTDGTRVLRDVLHHVAVPIPPDPRAAMRTSMKLRLRFLWRGPRVVAIDAARVPERGLLRLDALYGAARGTVMLDHRLADALAMHHLLGALDLGEPSRALRALCMEAASEANVGGRWLRKRSWMLLEEAEELAARTGAPYDRAVILVHRGAVSLFSARFRDAARFCEEALKIFRTRCAGAAWEITVCQSFLMAALTQLGRVRELRERARVLLEDARGRGDRYSMAFFQSGDCVLDALGRGDPLGALAGAGAALTGVPDAHFTSLHFGNLIAVARVHLYVGDGARAWTLVEEAWPKLRAGGFLSLEGIGVVLHYLRGCAALAAAEVAPAGGSASRWRLLRAARRAARRLRRVGLPTGRPLALAIEAGIHALVGDGAQRAAALEKAIAGFDAVEMALNRESARLLLGLITRSDAPLSRALGWFRDELVQDPVALARATLPGPFPATPSQTAEPSLS